MLDQVRITVGAGSIIAGNRVRCGLSEEDITARTGLSRTEILAIENNLIKATPAMIKKLAAIFDVPAKELAAR